MKQGLLDMAGIQMHDLTTAVVTYIRHGQDYEEVMES